MCFELKPASASRAPLTLRLAGCWILWSAWCSLSGWGLSAARLLSGAGHLVLLPVLLVAVWCWLKATASSASQPRHATPVFRRWFRPLPSIYLGIVSLSLLGALINPHPWSVDAAHYRLPRLLYWWVAHHWFWIGTLDHRLDFSSCGYEWQALPIIELTHSDRWLFLINFLPYLLMPALVFQGLRALGVSGRVAARWMWLLPAGYCYSLQCSGLQNDGYTVNYTLAAIVLAAAGCRNQPAMAWLAVLAVALLTGTKLSNLPLLLPLGLVLWPALRQIKLASWKTPAALAVAALCSFLPLAVLAVKFTGDWTGDPTDQWNAKAHNPVGAILANLVIFANDAAQLPLMPGSEHANALAASMEQRAGPFFKWLEYSNGEFNGLHFGEMPYEANAAIGFGIFLYLLLLICGALFRPPPDWAGGARAVPWRSRVIFASAWLAFGVFMAKLGSCQSARIAAPYFPLLLAPLLCWRRPALLERARFFQILAVFAALTVIPIIILTPTRPLVPFQALARMGGHPALEKIASQYRFWSELGDDLAPIRQALPEDATKLGYAGGFLDTSYGLWKPFGRRSVIELGLPLGSHSRPPPGVNYAVVTESGIQKRYDTALKNWLDAMGGKVIFQFKRNIVSDSRSAPKYEDWYLVKFN